jgi:hypothetical protein
MAAVWAVIMMLVVIWAATMTAIVWRLTRDERRRARARVAALASELSEPSDHRNAVQPAPNGAELFEQTPFAQSGSRLGPVLAVGVFAVVTALALTVAASRGGQASSRDVERNSTSAVERAATEAVPLELIALRHDRVADGITIRGVVRNPTSGTEWHNLNAVVFLFGRDGSFLTSGRANLDAASLAPGKESKFTVTVPEAGDVGRYRVSFRAEDAIVAHRDRRDRGPVARLK